MKNIFSILVALLATTSLWAYDFQSGDLCYNITSDTTVKVAWQFLQSSDNYSGMTSIVIPEKITYNGITYYVTGISNYAFYQCSSLTSITIPNTVTSIGEHAFGFCSSITSPIYNAHCFAYMPTSFIGSYEIPEGIVSIAAYAFEYCASLTSITIPESVTSIGNSAFRSCSSLTSMVVESGNSTYDSRDNCNAIIETATNTLIAGCQNTIIPNSVTSIGSNAFSGCYELTSITIPNTVKSIKEWAFVGCLALTSIVIPEGVTSIGYNAFYSCSALTSVIIPNSVTSIGSSAFGWCSKLAFINIPNGVTSISDLTFYKCSSLTSITIPESITSIASQAFYDCTSLTSITIPKSVIRIDRYAFSGCSALKNVIVEAPTPSYIGTDAFTSSPCCSIPCGTRDAYQASNWVSLVSEFIERGCESVDSTYHITYTTSDEKIINVDNSLFDASIVSHTYENGVGIITFATPLTKVNELAFAECKTLTSIEIPNSVTEMGGGAFYGCSALEKVKLSNNIKSLSTISWFDSSYFITIWKGFFENCTSLTSIDIPNSVTNIEEYAFRGCSSLSTVNISGSITNVGINAFEDTPWYAALSDGEILYIGTALYKWKGEMPENTKIEIREGTTSITSCAFMNYSNLVSVEMPNSVKTAGGGVFSGCTSLRNIVLSENLEILESHLVKESDISPTFNEYAGFFKNCYSLDSLTIPASIIAISDDAFSGCTFDLLINLSKCSSSNYWGAKVVKYVDYEVVDGLWIKDNVVVGCEGNLTSVSIPDGIVAIGDTAFSNSSSLLSVIIPSTVTSIGKEAFYNCTALTSITIPESVQSIGENAFLGCTFEKDNFINNSNCTSEDNWGATILNYDIDTDTVGWNVPAEALTVAQAREICAGLESGQSTDKAYYVKGYIKKLNSRNTQSITNYGTAQFYIEDVLGAYSSDDFMAFQVYGIDSTKLTDPNSVAVGDFVVIHGNLVNYNGTYETVGGGKAYIWRSTNPLLAKNNEGTEDEEDPEEKYTITYTSTDGNIVTPRNANVFGANIISNTYENGVGTITFDRPVTSIGDGAFFYLKTLTSVTIPNSVMSIGKDAFSVCSALKSIIIPESVTSIGEQAFRYCFSLTSVTIPNSITSIRERTFEECTSLISITIPNSVTSIEDFAFYGCSALDSIVIGNNVISIGDNVFYNTGLYNNESNWEDSVLYIGNYLIRAKEDISGSYTIKDNTRLIGDYAFCWCSSLKSITIPNSVKSIGDGIFYESDSLSCIVVEGGNTTYDSRDNCNAIIETATNTLIVGCKNTIIPTTVTNIGNSAFAGCPLLTSITIPESVTSIGDLAFSKCYFMKSKFINHSNCTSEDNWGATILNYDIETDTVGWNVPAEALSIAQAREICAGLESGTQTTQRHYVMGYVKRIHFMHEDGVANYGNAQFYIEDVLGAQSTSDFYAFQVYGVDSTKLTDPNSVAVGDFVVIHGNLVNYNGTYETVGGGKSYIWKSTNPLLANSDNNNDNNDEDGVKDNQIKYTTSDGKVINVENYSFDANIVSNTYENGVGTIMFDVPVTTIKELAFKAQSTLTSITLPNSVVTVGGGVFSGCTALEEVKLSEKMQELPLYLLHKPYYDIYESYGFFEGCSALTSIVIPNSVKNIGENAFKGCANLASISIPDDITYIDVNAFEGTPWYNSLPDGELYFGKVFYKYKGKMLENTSIKIQEGTIGITTHAFNSCSNLVSVVIPNSVTQIGGAIFSNCTSLKDVVLPTSIKSLNSYCTFYCPFAWSCSEFDGFFDNCKSLTSLKLPSSIEYIGECAFSLCENLDTLLLYSVTPPVCDDQGYDGWDLFYKTTIKKIFVHNKSVQLYKKEWSRFADIIFPFPGEALFLTPITTKNITQTTASINAIITNADGAYAYNVGYISKEDTVYLEYSDTLEFTVANLYPNQSNQITLFVGKKDEPFDYYVFEQVNVQTKSISMNVQVPTTTQTTVKIILSCNAGDATPIERGIILTHPDGRKDTIPFEINQTDTTIRGLVPYSNYVASGYCTFEGGNQILASNSKFTTKDIYVYIYTKSKTQTTLHIGLGYNAGDATITDKGLIVHCPNGKIDTISIKNTYEGITGDTLLTQLRINSEYDVYGFILTEEGGLKVGNGNAIYTNNIESTITSSNRTQTTIPLSASLELGDATDYNKNGLQWTIGSSFNSNNYETIYFKEGVFDLDTTFTNLSPNTQYAFRLFHYSVDEIGKEYCVYGDTRKFTTSSVVLYEPTLQTTGQTYIEVQTNNVYGDATLIEEVVEVATSRYSTPEQRVNVAGRSNVIINNLMPNTKYYFRSVLNTRETGILQSEWYEATTKQINLATGEADGISNTSAFLHGTIDCDTMSRTEIGFEWKRSDAPSTVKPQRLLVVDRVDENLIFRLEGLSRDRYYDFRTFCLYNGQEYYGEWVGFLTSDQDVLIPPSVQTLNAEITELGVLMKGFVVAGTEVILQCGFECWREGSEQVVTTVVETTMMSSYIPDAWSYVTYKYRAYAKTPAGTVYGETLEISTGYISTDIPDVTVNASSNSAQITWTFIEQADYYILTLYADENMTEVIGVYTVDKNGNITQKRVASSMPLLVTCNLIDLLPGTNYYFAVKAYNDEDQMVAEESGTFATSQISTSLENLNVPTNHCEKIIRNGQLIILRDGVEYNAMGQEL